MKKIDWAFVERQESRKLTAYVPKDSGKNLSGVTVGTGIDLGQRDRAEIMNTFIPDDLKRKILPYALLKGDKAREALRLRPLTLTNDEVTALDTAIQRQFLYRLETRFDRDAEAHFDCLPAEAQTVLMSLAWNFGPALDKALPTAWGFAIVGRWDQMADFIENMPCVEKALKSRRKREADLLRKIPA
jgi:hypothetical protein